MTSLTGVAGGTAHSTRTLPAEAEILRALADVEREDRLALAGLCAVNQRDRVFDLEAAKLLGERLAGEQLNVEKAVLDILVRDFPRLAARISRQGNHGQGC